MTMGDNLPTLILEVAKVVAVSILGLQIPAWAKQCSPEKIIRKLNSCSSAAIIARSGPYFKECLE